MQVLFSLSLLSCICALPPVGSDNPPTQGSNGCVYDAWSEWGPCLLEGPFKGYYTRERAYLGPQTKKLIKKCSHIFQKLKCCKTPKVLCGTNLLQKVINASI
jgi:hypothetical protein